MSSGQLWTVGQGCKKLQKAAATGVRCCRVPMYLLHPNNSVHPSPLIGSLLAVDGAALYEQEYLRCLHPSTHSHFPALCTACSRFLLLLSRVNSRVVVQYV